jgi:hypothetical protein
MRADRPHQCRVRAPPILTARDRPESEVTVPVPRLILLPLLSWLAAMSSLVALRITLVNAAVSPTEYLAWVFVYCAPAAIALVVVRDRTDRSVTQVLYELEHHGDNRVSVPRG